MLNYTNGNWEYAQGEFNYAHDKEAVADGEELLGSIVCGDWIICRIDNANEWKANALLISQAPAMYEALKAFVERTKRAKGVEFSPGMMGAFIAMKEVLSKLEGDK